MVERLIGASLVLALLALFIVLDARKSRGNQRIRYESMGRAMLRDLSITAILSGVLMLVAECAVGALS